jgi:hypothetical protein
MTHRSSLRQWWCGPNLQRKSWTRGFFSCSGRVSFTLRTFGAQINWRFISRKILFDPHRFLSNKLPIHSTGESGKGNMNVSQCQMACSKQKWTSIATVPDLCPTTVKILTHLISRYQLPLTVSCKTIPLPWSMLSCKAKACQRRKSPNLLVSGTVFVSACGS